MLCAFRRLDRVATFCATLFCCAVCLASTARAETPIQNKTIYIPTRGTSVRVLLMLPTNPKAGAIVLPGGHGNINLDVQGQIGWGADQPVIALRGALAASGYALAIMDVPSDRKPPASLAGYRASPNQAADIAAVADYLRAYTRSLFLLAFDSGAVSAVDAAKRNAGSSAKPDQAFAGMVFVAPATVAGRRNGLPLDAVKSLEGIDLPVLIVEEETDRCSNSPVSGAKALAETGKSERSKPGLVLLPRKAGSSFEIGVCGAGSAHEFFDTSDFYTVGNAAAPINPDETALLDVITRWLQGQAD